MSRKKNKRKGNSFTQIPRSNEPLPKVDRDPCDYRKHSLLQFMKNIEALGKFYQYGDSFHTLKLRLIDEGKSAKFYDEATFDFIISLIVSNRKTLAAWLVLSDQMNPPNPVPERKQDSE